MKPEGTNGWRLWRETLAAISLGWDLALPIFAGVLIGYFLDRWLGTGHIFTLGLLVFGIGVGYNNLARFIRRVQTREQADTERKQLQSNEDDTA